MCDEGEQRVVDGGGRQDEIYESSGSRRFGKTDGGD